ncbi:MAG TPA: glycine dehydrogenase, partial [Bacillota bacterium]
MSSAFRHPYLPHTDEDRRAMLEAVGARSVEDLFDQVPAAVRLGRPLNLPPGLSEPELLAHMEQLAARNGHTGAYTCFLGAGVYDHYVPALVDEIISRGEFYTSYTPYQPEVSQGNLQAIYEFQTMICELTGMDVANASMYDGASAAAEAALMAVNVTRRERIVVAGTVHPEYRQVIRTYTERQGLAVTEVPRDGGG